MRKRILIVAPYARWTPHHETELELAESHLIAGDEVHWLECLRDLPFCEPNPEHTLARCVGCAAKARHGRSLLSGAVQVVRVPECDASESGALAKRMEEITDLDALRAFSIDGFDIGLGIASSLISVLEDPSPDLADGRVRGLAARIAESALRVFVGVRRLLAREAFDVVYVLNGRFAAPRGALRAALGAGVHCVVHERGATPDKYMLRHDAIAHDLRQLREEVDSLWVEAGEQEGWINAGRVFERMRAGASPGWLSYTAAQRPDHLPESWDRRLRNVVFFASSEDEFQALEAEWRWIVFPSQVEGIRRLRQLLAGDDGIKFWVRMHPNQARMPQHALAPYFELGSEEGIEVIAPGSPISSYAMVDAADCVVTFGSTIGIEAAYWGRPSVLLAQAPFRAMGSTYDAESVEQAKAWLADRSLAALPRLGAAKYGNYLMTFGRPFVHFRSAGFFGGEFRGRRVRAGVSRRLAVALPLAFAELRRYVRGARRPT